MVTVTAVMVAMASRASSKRQLPWLMLLLPALAWAGDWKFASGVTFSERYSDNINLATSGTVQSDWITEITPRVSASRAGTRLTVNADYSLQGLLYADDSDSNRIRHNLNGRVAAELVEDWFYLDASARISHEPKSLTSGYGLGDPVGIGNTTSVGGYTLSPYMKHRFGSAATVEARLSRDDVFIGDSTLSDTGTTRYTLSAVSGTDFFPLSWNANYSKSNTNNSVGSGVGSERASLNARYQLSRKFGLLAQASMEKNDFTGANATLRDYSSYGLGFFYTPSRRISLDALYNTSDDGDFLSGSVTLSPTPRTALTASSGKRSYGRNYGLNLTHRARKSTWSLLYQDDLTISQQQFLNYLGDVYVYRCPTGTEYLPLGTPPSDPANCTLNNIVRVFNQAQLNETYVAKTLTGTVSYTLRRNTWLLSLYENRRDIQRTGENDTTRGVQVSWSLIPAAHTTFTLTGGLSKAESNGGTLGNRQDDLWNLGLVATHQFKPKVSGSVEVRHQERASNQATGDYSENSLAARLNMSF